MHSPLNLATSASSCAGSRRWTSASCDEGCSSSLSGGCESPASRARRRSERSSAVRPPWCSRSAASLRDVPAASAAPRQRTRDGTALGTGASTGPGRRRSRVAVRVLQRGISAERSAPASPSAFALQPAGRRRGTRVGPAAEPGPEISASPPLRGHGRIRATSGAPADHDTCFFRAGRATIDAK